VSKLERLLSSLPAGDLVSDPLVLIPTFNNGAYLLNFINQLQRLDLTRYLVIDGGSSEPATLRVLGDLQEENRVMVVANNPGPRYFFESAEIFDSLPPIFCVSDPDLDLNEKLPTDFLQNLYDVSVQFSTGKVGFALDLDEDLIEEEFFFYGEWHTIRGWEEKYWRDRVPNTLDLEVYRAEIDTTFALYNKLYLHPDDFFSALRVAGDFTASHLPWLKDNPLDKPLSFRDDPALHSWTTWSKASSLADLRKVNERNEHKLRLMENSFSWKITAPLRTIGRLLQKINLIIGLGPPNSVSKPIRRSSRPYTPRDSNPEPTD